MFALILICLIFQLPAKLGLLDKLNRIEVELCPIEGPIQDIMKGEMTPAKDVVGFLHSVFEEYVHGCFSREGS